MLFDTEDLFLLREALKLYEKDIKDSSYPEAAKQEDLEMVRRVQDKINLHFQIEDNSQNLES